MASSFYETEIEKLIKNYTPRQLAEIVLTYKGAKQAYIDKNKELEKENTSLRRLITKIQEE